MTTGFVNLDALTEADRVRLVALLKERDDLLASLAALREQLPKIIFDAVDAGRMLPPSTFGCKSTPEKAAAFDAVTRERADLLLSRLRAEQPAEGEKNGQ